MASSPKKKNISSVLKYAGSAAAGAIGARVALALVEKIVPSPASRIALTGISVLLMYKSKNELVRMAALGATTTGVLTSLQSFGLTGNLAGLGESDSLSNYALEQVPYAEVVN
jgi:hypothetical protein